MFIVLCWGELIRKGGTFSVIFLAKEIIWLSIHPTLVDNNTADTKFTFHLTEASNYYYYVEKGTKTGLW